MFLKKNKLSQGPNQIISINNHQKELAISTKLNINIFKCSKIQIKFKTVNFY